MFFANLLLALLLHWEKQYKNANFSVVPYKVSLRKSYDSQGQGNPCKCYVVESSWRRLPESVCRILTWLQCHSSDDWLFTAQLEQSSLSINAIAISLARCWWLQFKALKFRKSVLRLLNSLFSCLWECLKKVEAVGGDLVLCFDERRRKRIDKIGLKLPMCDVVWHGILPS